MKSKFLYFLSIMNLLMLCLCFISFSTKEDFSMNFSDKILKVRGIVVVDSLGIERVIVGSHLPEPNFANGHRIAGRGKGGSVSGVMIYDHEGQERGGYVTDDNFGNAFLSLDSKTQQHLLLLSEPQGGANLMMWDKGNKISMGVNPENASIEIIKNNKKVKLYEEDKN